MDLNEMSRMYRLKKLKDLAFQSYLRVANQGTPEASRNLGNKQVYMDIRRVQNRLAHRTSFRDDLLQDIAKCIHRLGVSGKMSLASAGLLGQRSIELRNHLLKKYGICLFSYDISKCRTINDLIITIGKVSGRRIQLPYR